ncbi:hypothetical protein DLAC_09093 [Tieghemostelium lacteum]|uniref:Uncharacterized protein n=1 Tax=Tieghemostelium lacteum TaxID=361077 RepID=A0A151Z940_TIELA|nr:hypothetical protein DLAC_09093 [Tieghemostelium lacteum]|eukprot:KYQ90470.1 hypothetical protein DLAC_09093 [Tieghemostelium lacteum]
MLSIEKTFYNVFRNKFLFNLIFKYVKIWNRQNRTTREKNYFEVTVGDCIHWKRQDLLDEKLELHQRIYQKTNDLNYYLDFTCDDVMKFLSSQPDFDRFIRYYSIFKLQFDMTFIQFYTSKEYTISHINTYKLDKQIVNIILEVIEIDNEKKELPPPVIMCNGDILEFYHKRLGLEGLYRVYGNDKTKIYGNLRTAIQLGFQSYPVAYSLFHSVITEQNIRSLCEDAFNHSNVEMFKYIVKKHSITGKMILQATYMTSKHIEMLQYLPEKTPIELHPFVNVEWNLEHLEWVNSVYPTVLKEKIHTFSFPSGENKQTLTIPMISNLLAFLQKQMIPECKDKISWDIVFKIALESNDLPMIKYMETLDISSKYKFNIVDAPYEILEYLLPQESTKRNSNFGVFYNPVYTKTHFFFGGAQLTKGYHNDTRILELFRKYPEYQLSNRSATSAIKLGYIDIVDYIYQHFPSLFGLYYFNDAVVNCDLSMVRYLAPKINDPKFIVSISLYDVINNNSVEIAKLLVKYFYKDKLHLGLAKNCNVTKHSFSKITEEMLQYTKYSDISMATKGNVDKSIFKGFMPFFIESDNFQMVEYMLKKVNRDYVVTYTTVNTLLSKGRYKMLLYLIKNLSYHSANIISTIIDLMKIDNPVRRYLLSSTLEIASVEFYFEIYQSLNYRKYESIEYYYQHDFKPLFRALSQLNCGKFSDKFVNIKQNIPAHLLNYLSKMNVLNYFFKNNNENQTPIENMLTFVNIPKIPKVPKI